MVSTKILRYNTLTVPILNCKFSKETVKMTCKIDALGRIVIPKDIRKMIDLQGRDNISIVVENNTVILRKRENKI